MSAQFTAEQSEAIRRAIQISQAISSYRQRNLLFRFFPDDDSDPKFPARARYPKHLEFFRLGRDKFARFAMAANGLGKCSTIHSLIDTAHGRVSMGALMQNGEPFDVWAWDEEKQQRVVTRALAPFKKPGLHECYRLTMADGQWIEVADHHRFLSSDGWRRLSELLAESAPDHLASSSGRGLAAHGEGDPHWSRTLRDFAARCFAGLRPYGEQPLFAGGTGPAFARSPADARPHTRPWWRSGDLGRRCTSTARQVLGRLSSTDAARLDERHGFAFSDPFERTFAGRMTASIETALQRLSASAPQLRSGGEADPCLFSALVDPFMAGNRVVSCRPIGSHEVYDFTVPVHHNYIAGGLVNHNTESMGGYESAWHLRGEYPEWWPGHRFDGPVDAWFGGATHESVRDVLQTKLLGKPYMEAEGGGLIPVEWIDLSSITRMSNPAGRIDSFRVRRKDGGFSFVKFKSYDQGVNAFVGTEKDLIWLDEPPPLEIFAQCAARTRNRPQARIMITATPLEGRTETVALFLDNEDPSRAIIRAGWADAPHLTDEDKAKIRAQQPAYLRNAVEFGDPTRQGGAVYGLPEADIVCEPFTIPKHWRWFYAMDTGFKYTAVVWFAHNLDNDTLYLVSDYKAGGYDQASGDAIDYTVHATRIRARNKMLTGMADLPGVADAAAIQITDGRKILSLYQACGLNLVLPNKAVIAGIAAVTERFANGSLKIFNSCFTTIKEFREYSVDDQGRPVKVNDHLMDAMRYGVMSGIDIAVSRADMMGGGNAIKRISY